MYIPGHISVGVLLAAAPAVARRQPLRVQTALYPVVLGALTPDIIDKSIQFAELSPYGRTVGHSIYVWALVALIWKWSELRRARWARPVGWWVAGWASHLGADLVNDVVRGYEHTGYLFAAWFGWPYTNPDMWQIQLDIADPCRTCVSSLEVVTVALAFVVALAGYLQFRRGLHELMPHR